MTLIELLTKNEQAYISELLKGSYLDQGSYGVGATKNGSDWIWLSSEQKLDYSLPWRTGQPDNYMGNENCLVAHKSDKFGIQFNDLQCDGNSYEDQVYTLCENEVKACPKPKTCPTITCPIFEPCPEPCQTID